MDVPRETLPVASDTAISTVRIAMSEASSTRFMAAEPEVAEAAAATAAAVR